jgi:DNA repair protein RecO (recombination protein O)
MRIAQEPAFVLHHHDYGETSLLLEIFTRQHGRIGVLAKGARRPRSPLRSALVPFQPLVVNYSGRGELPVLATAEPLGMAPPLTGEALFCGLYLNELLLRLLHRHDPHEQLFATYAETLIQLSSDRMEEVLRRFEKRLLEDIGYGLALEHDAQDGRPLDPNVLYRYQPERGPVSEQGAGDEGIRVQGRTLLALAAESLDDEQVLQEAKTLLRALLARHLGDRPLMSRNLFRAANRPDVPARREDALE